MKRAYFVAVLTGEVALAACVSLTPQGAAVRITTNPEVVRGCQFLGNVAGNSTTWNLVGNPYGQPGGGDVQNAENELRNRAGAIGADVIYINTQNAWRVVGEAYSCRREQYSGVPGLDDRRGSPFGRYLEGLFDQMQASGEPYSRLRDLVIRIKQLSQMRPLLEAVLARVATTATDPAPERLPDKPMELPRLPAISG